MERVIILLMPFWVFVSFSGETRGQLGQHTGAANIDVCKQGEIYIYTESCFPSAGDSSWRPWVIFKPIVHYPPKGEKDELKKQLHIDLAAPQQPASVPLSCCKGRSADRRQVLKCGFACTQERSVSSFAIIWLLQWLCFLWGVSKVSTLQEKLILLW